MKENDGICSLCPLLAILLHSEYLAHNDHFKPFEIKKSGKF
jgi:hypothetical protein